MEPTSIAVAFNVLSKAFGVGLATYKFRKEWELNADAVEAIASAFGGAGDLVGMLPRGGSKEVVRLFALHAALVTCAFGAACKDHWAGNTEMAPSFDKPSRLRALFQSNEESEKKSDIESRLKRAMDRVGALDRGGASRTFDMVSAMVGEPLSSPWYQALWEAFTNPLLEDGERSRWLELEDSGAKLEFERAYRLTYAEALISTAGAEVARGALQLHASRPELLREMLVRAMSTWDRQHVFGADDTPGVPNMPLKDIYVEPEGIYEERKVGETIARRAPIRELINKLREKCNVVIVRGDFGNGKSLTARMLASEWAKKYLGEQSISSPEMVFPIFIKCGEDFRGHNPSLKDVVARAFKRQAKAIGLDNARRDDDAFALPPTSQRIVYLVDGLDEVALTSGEVEDFLKDLEDNTTARHTAIVFSRKGVIPLPEKLRGIPVVDVQHFEKRQVIEWLQKWNSLGGKSSLSVNQLQEKKLLDIVTTPIVLFMAAVTWDEQHDAGTPLVQAELYERFFRQIAAGKCKQDQNQHGPVIESSRAVLDRLIEMKELDVPTSGDEAKGLSLAMLWLISRVAWEGQRCARKGNELTLHEITTILRAEFGFRNDPKVEEMIRIGVLLVLQADHHGGNDRILFGHKSFREFLIARYWASQLRRIVRTRERDRPALEKKLLGARLLDVDDGAFDFLVQILDSSEWDDNREELVNWAQDCFNDEGPAFVNSEPGTWREDQRPILREAALAIGSSVRGSKGISIAHPLTLRTMLGWFWIMGIDPIIIAPRLFAAGANLSGVKLASRAILAGANLANANLDGAKLYRANLESANFQQATLIGANVYKADLSGANLRAARLCGADMFGANLVGANLDGADLSRADLNWVHWNETTTWPANIVIGDHHDVSFKDAPE